MNNQASWKVLVLFALLSLVACKEVEVLQNGTSPPYTIVLPRDAATRKLQELFPELAAKRVIYVGETHSNYGHHLLQLAVIRGLHARGVDLAIGMEAFQTPFQPWLDAWVRGKISEAEMLEKTQWYERWQFDYRLYRPILEFAREHRIPVIALNVPRELTSKISEKGIEGLEREERARLPEEIDRSDQAYRERLYKVFSQHRSKKESQFERFLDVQYTWDEGMAQRVADYLAEHPEKTMVVLAGSGHLAYGSGIPKRVARRLGGDYLIILPESGRWEPGKADYLVAVEHRELPSKGLMGILIGRSEKGILVDGVTPGSAAEKAGIQRGDILVRIDGEPVSSLPELRIKMLDKGPGERIRVDLKRNDRSLIKELVLGRVPH